MLKRNKLALSVQAAALVTGGLLATQAIAEEAIEEVQVTGIRGALMDSLNAKRSSDSIVDVITAEDIGKFPDMNVAESLQRMPGVTIQRQFGEGAAVSIRGAGNELTLTTLNGQNVASTGWFVLEPAKRSFNYELLPSELVGNLEVYKSSQADLAEGGVGGTVVVNTRKPLDLDELVLRGAVENSWQSDSGEADPQVSGLMSWKNEEGNFGVLVSALQQSRSLQRQGNEAFWEWGAGPVAFEQERERSAVSATFQWQPTDELEVVFNAIDMQMAADNTNYALWLTQGNTGWSANPATDAEKLNGTAVRGPLNVAYWQARPREATMNSEVFDLTTTYQGDGYELKVQAGTTSSTGGTDFEMVVDDGSGGTPIPGGTYEFGNGKQTWDLNGFDIANYDPGSLNMGTGAAFNATPKTDDEDYFQADLELDVEFGAVHSIKTGIKTASHNTTSRQFFFEQDPSFVPSISTDGLRDGTIESGDGSYDIAKFDADALKAWAKSSITGKTEDLGSYSEIDETNNAFYLMANFESGEFSGNFGVRYVTTDATSTYYIDGVKTKTDADYSEVLPSLTVNYNWSEDVIVRAAAARTMARPQYVDMYVNPSPIGANDDTPNNQFWVVGNVGLKPFMANSFDLSAEWYFAEGSLVFAGVFYKDVENFVSISEYQADAADIPFELDDIRTNETDFGWTVQEKDNAKEASIHGIELQFQQDFGNGFGTIVNYTWTDTDTDEDTFTDGNPYLSDSSENTYNVTGYYEADQYQVRLAYNWRSEYMIRESGSYGNRLHDDFGSLDLSAVWHVTDSIDVQLDANNLLEESAEQFGNNAFITPGSGFTPGFPLYSYETARRVNLGVTAKF